MAIVLKSATPLNIVEATNYCELRRFVMLHPLTVSMISPAALSVYIALLGHLDGESNMCDPSTRRLMSICKMSNKTIMKARNELKSIGLIKIIEDKLELGKVQYSYEVFRFDEVFETWFDTDTGKTFDR